jgi:hypothetical protein
MSISFDKLEPSVQQELIKLTQSRLQEAKKHSVRDTLIGVAALGMPVVVLVGGALKTAASFSESPHSAAGLATFSLAASLVVSSCFNYLISTIESGDRGRDCRSLSDLSPLRIIPSAKKMFNRIAFLNWVMNNRQ